MANDKIFRTIGGMVGNIERKTFASGKEVLLFGIGVSDLDFSQNKLNWVNVKVWEPTAGQIEDAIQKGDKLIVSGPCEVYNDRWTLTVWDWAKLDRKPRESKPNPGYERLPDRSEIPMSQAGLSRPPLEELPPSTVDDDIPF